MGLSLLSCKWALQIVLHLLDSPKRPSELKRLIEGFEERVLFDRLKRLYSAGLIGRRESYGYPKETFYYLKEPEKVRAVGDWVSGLDLPLQDIVSVVSCRWTLEILELLKEERTPKELKDRLCGIGDKMLHRRLSELEGMRLVERKNIPTKPVRVLYTLTPTGLRLLPNFRNLKELILCKGKIRSQASSPAHDS